MENKNNKLKILSLGGVAVNKNMYVYETDNDIIVVDCGIAFPTEDMPGIDLIIPDVSYLLERQEKIRGIFLTHGHEDHRGGLPYILPEFKNPLPVYGTKLTIGLSQIRCQENGIKVDWREAKYGEKITTGDFTVEFVHVTHSIPDAANLIIQTPTGVVYHGSDFKFDWTPVDGLPTDVGRIAQAGKNGILCLMSDCLRVEKSGYTLSEKTIEETFEVAMRKCPGKFILTTQSSNISRIQQVANAASRFNRKIAFAGRSVEQNAEAAVRLGYLNLPKNLVIKVEDINRYNPKEIVVVATGSQGQESSALSRMANGEHKIKIRDGDYVVFSQDAIPGSEAAVNDLIDTLTKIGAEVFYSAILDDLHVSGNEAADGLRLMLSLTNPKYVWPIGGTERHIKHYTRLAAGMGYSPSNILTPPEGQTIEFENGNTRLGTKVNTRNVLIDGLGIGDVGNVVLRDRQTMAADGMVTVLIPIEKATGEMVGDIELVSRGFVYMKESEELIGEAKEVVRKTITDHFHSGNDFRHLKRIVTDELEKFLFSSTHRRPLILPVIVEI